MGLEEGKVQLSQRPQEDAVWGEASSQRVPEPQLLKMNRWWQAQWWLTPSILAFGR